MQALLSQQGCDPWREYTFFHSKGNHKQNEKTTYGLGENCILCSQQGLNFQNIQTVHTTQ